MEVKGQHYPPPILFRLSPRKAFISRMENDLGLTLVLAFWRRKDSWQPGFELSNLGCSTATPIIILSQLLVNVKQTHYSTEWALRVTGF